jgi:hypothetical protein
MVTQRTTRRSPVTGLVGATVAATGLPAGAAEPDPIFAALAAHKAGYDECRIAVSATEYDAAHGRFYE